MGLIVQKYGGTSVKDAERVMNVARRITDAYKSTRMPQSVKWICCFQQVSKFQFLCLQWQ